MAVPLHLWFFDEAATFVWESSRDIVVDHDHGRQSATAHAPDGVQAEPVGDRLPVLIQLPFEFLETSGLPNMAGAETDERRLPWGPEAKARKTWPSSPRRGGQLETAEAGGEGGSSAWMS
jgi:hypothetical protein